MTSFLFITSFLLHIVTIYTMIQFYFKYESLKNLDSRETLELMETYLQEIKVENDRLHELITKNQFEESRNIKAENEELGKNDKVLKNTNNFPVLDDNINDTVEASLEAKVLQLHDQGLSITEIARKLHCGKTETELIIN